MKYEIEKSILVNAINLIANAAHAESSYLEVSNVIGALQRLPIIQEIEEKIEEKVCGKSKKKTKK